MAKRKRRVFTDEFKADAVRLYKAGGRSIGQVATDLDVGETGLRTWLKQAEDAVAADGGPAGALTAAERGELGELRKRVKRLEMEREILKKAAAFVCHENALPRQGVNCIRDEGRPLGIGLQGQVPNHLELRR